MFLQQNPKKSDFSLSGLGKPISNLSTFKQLQACHGEVKGENLQKGPNNVIIECKGVRGHDQVNQLKTLAKGIVYRSKVS